MHLRIAHLSFSSSGGAGNVATRLAELQRAAGHDASVISCINGSLRDAPFASPLITLAASIDEYVVKKKEFAAPISLFRDKLGPVRAADLRSYDIVHVHWPNGLIRLHELSGIREESKVVWTLHDMNPFSPVAHYTLGIEDTASEAGTPAVRRFWQPAALRHFRAKVGAIGNVPNLSVVAPSRWMSNQAQNSKVFDGHRISMIPNPLPQGARTRIGLDSARARLGIPVDAKAVFCLAAANLDDPLKSAQSAIQAFRRAFSEDPKIHLLVVGRGKQIEKSDSIHYLGYVPQQTSWLALSASNYLVVPSLAENQPLIVAEAQAAGTSIVVRNVSGLPEHCSIDPCGLLFDTDEALPGVLRRAASRLPDLQSREALRKQALEMFDSERIQNRYLEIYDT